LLLQSILGKSLVEKTTIKAVIARVVALNASQSKAILRKIGVSVHAVARWLN